MKKTLFKIFCSLAAVVFITSACEKDLDLKIQQQGGQLVLFSFVSPDSVFKVHVSKSVSQLSVNDFERVYNGRVRVYQNGKLVDTFFYPFDQLWAVRPEIKMQEGDALRVVVNDQTGLTAIGETRVPVAVPITRLDTITRISRSGDGTRRKMLNCTITISDPAEHSNYYQLYLIEKTCTSSGDETVCVKHRVDFTKDDKVFYLRDQEGSLLGGVDFEGSFSDFLFQGQIYDLNLRIPLLYKAVPPQGTQRTLYFLLVSQTQDYFHYFRSRIVAEYSYNLPVIDPVKIFQNVEGGLGLVGGYSVAVDSLVFSANSK